MKAMNRVFKAVTIVCLSTNLVACGNKKSGETATQAASHKAICTRVNGLYVVSGTTTPCSTICPAEGKWTDLYSNIVYTCTPGEQVGTQYLPPTNYGNWGGGYQYGGCDQYELYYGVQYVPIYMAHLGQHMCVRYDVLYGRQTYYQYRDYDYYFAYPPYTGYGCNNRVDIGGGWGSIGLCY